MDGMITNDPVEIHIYNEFMSLRATNERLRRYVDQSGKSAELKDINIWKPYDFLKYFCKLYYDKYKKEYNVKGNVVRAYNKISMFMGENHINNQSFKDFIEYAFNRYFTDARVPVLGNVCSAKLYNRLMVASAKDASRVDKFSLDEALKNESLAFEEYVHNEYEFESLGATQ